jgi:hypothetical protein
MVSKRSSGSFDPSQQIRKERMGERERERERINEMNLCGMLCKKERRRREGGNEQGRAPKVLQRHRRASLTPYQRRRSLWGW